MTKELFVETINFIQKEHSKEDIFNQALNELSPDTRCDCFLYSDYEEITVKLLEDAMNDKNGMIWSYLCDDNYPVDEKGNRYFYSPETLYNYLLTLQE